MGGDQASQPWWVPHTTYGVGVTRIGTVTNRTLRSLPVSPSLVKEHECSLRGYGKRAQEAQSARRSKFSAMSGVTDSDKGVL